MPVEKSNNNATLLGDLHHKYETLPGYSRSETRSALNLLGSENPQDCLVAAGLILNRNPIEGVPRLIAESPLDPIDKLTMLLRQRESELEKKG